MRFAPLMLSWMACRAQAPAGLLPAGDAGDRMIRPPSVRWQAPIGMTTYRHAILVDRGQVVVGSNGASWRGVEDADGLYVVDARDGTVLHHVALPGEGETDGNGVAASDDAWLVGTDQGAVHRVSRRDASVEWSHPTGGDIEGTPVLYDASGDGVLDVAVAVEQGPLLVLDGTSGDTLLEIDERPHFAAPAAADVTGDGVPELFVALRDGRLYAADGRTGARLWTLTAPGRRYAAPVLADIDRDGDLELLSARWQDRIDVVEPLDGSLLDTWWVEGGWLYGLGYHAAAGIAVAGTATGGYRTDNAVVATGSDGERWRRPLPPTRISGSPVVGDVDGRPGDEIVIAAESGQVLALDTEGRTVWAWQAGGPVETPPALADLDGDGRIEVLIASQDGLLTALDTRGIAPAAGGHWRGGPRNEGVLGGRP